MIVKYVKIKGISCDACRKKIKKELLKIKNVKGVNIDRDIATITFDEKIDDNEIINAVNNLGYFTKTKYVGNTLEELNSGVSVKEFFIIILAVLLIVFLIQKVFGYNIFNVLPTIDDNATYGMLFITGVLTSIHCISMCGAINLAAVVSKENKVSLKRPLLYNIGRLCSYILLGGIVGLIGSLFSASETINGLIIIIAALLMFLLSLDMLNVISFKMPRLVNFSNNLKTRNSFALGILNGFMPCGPLQAMQVYALSTGSFVKRSFIDVYFLCWDNSSNARSWSAF